MRLAQALNHNRLNEFHTLCELFERSSIQHACTVVSALRPFHFYFLGDEWKWFA